MEDHPKSQGPLLDTRALKQAEPTLLEREQRAAIILQAAQLGIHECDTEGRITFVNPSQERITGYTADELLGTYVWDRIAPGPQKASLPAYLKQLVSEQPPPTPYMAKNIRKNGEVYETRVDWNYKRDAQGRVTGFVTVISDVTEQRKAEAALRKSHDDLEQEVQQRTAELAAANQRLQREVDQRRRTEQQLEIVVAGLKDRTVALEAYAAELGRINERLHKQEQHLLNLMQLQDRDRQLIGFEIHDELVQLLTGATMHLDSFRQACQPGASEAWTEFEAGFGLLGKGIREARRLINGLRPPSLDVGGVVDAIADLVQEIQARERRPIEFLEAVRFQRLPRQLENTIFRIVQEALMNACRHSNSPRIRIGLCQEADRLTIEVRDWGVGFDPESVGADRFGLESIRERARVFGGHATVESRPGEGTRVLAELPLPEGWKA